MKRKRSLLDRVNRISRGCSERSVRAIARESPNISTPCAKSSGAFRRRKSRTATRRCRCRIGRSASRRRFDDHLKLLYDLQWLAYQGDLTRVFTLMYGRELNSRQLSRRSASRSRITACRITATGRSRSRSSRGSTPIRSELFAYFLEKLRSTPDGDGNLLDHTHPSLRRRDEQSERPSARQSAAGRRGRRSRPSEGRTPPRVQAGATTCR